MKKITVICCLLAVLFAYAQYTGPGFYRVHNAGTDRYISIKGTHYERTTNPDAFWSCVKMEMAPNQVADPGTIIYIPDTVETSLFAQGVDTYSLTGLTIRVAFAKKNEGGKQSYIAQTWVDEFFGGSIPCIFRDFGIGFTAGTVENAQCRWWIEPVNEETMEESYFGLQPVNNANEDSDIEYWSTLCCDFPCLIPEGSGVEGAYTVKDVKIDEDQIAKAIVEKIYGQGDTIPAATPVLVKCTAPDASGNKLVPVGEIARCTAMPISADRLMGNYFSIFTNHAHLTDASVMGEYLPEQATVATENYLALGVDEEGTVGFFAKEEGTYMEANTAWLNITDLELDGVTAIYLMEQVEEEDPEDPVEPLVEGDINGDGMTTLDDMTLLINYLLTSVDEVPTRALNLEAVDMNHDGIITIDDLTLLINYLLTA